MSPIPNKENTSTPRSLQSLPYRVLELYSKQNRSHNISENTNRLQQRTYNASTEISTRRDKNWNSKLSRGRNKHLHFEELRFLVCSNGQIDRNKLIVFYPLLSKSGQHPSSAGRVRHSIDLDRHVWTDDTNTDEVKERKMGTRVFKMQIDWRWWLQWERCLEKYGGALSVYRTQHVLRHDNPHVPQQLRLRSRLPRPENTTTSRNTTRSRTVFCVR